MCVFDVCRNERESRNGWMCVLYIVSSGREGGGYILLCAYIACRG